MLDAHFYTAYPCHNAQAGLPVLILPGVNCGGWLFEDALPQLTAHHPVILFHNPGINGAPIGHHLSVAQIAAVVVQLVQELNLGRFHLVGHSMGGFVAQQVAYRLQHQVASLALVSTCYGQPQTTKDIGSLAVAIGKDFNSWQYEVLHKPEEALKILFSDVFLREKPDVYTRFIAKRQQYWPGKAVSALHLMAGGLYSGYRVLPQLSMRTLVMHGEGDVLITPQSGRKLAEALPNARWLGYPLMGHFPMLEDETLFYQNLLDFWAGKTVGIKLDMVVAEHPVANQSPLDVMQQSWHWAKNALGKKKRP